MLPGKTYTPAHYLAIVWRRRWFVVIPVLVVSTATAVVSAFLPNRYRASASILILPQRVPEDFVQSTVTATLQERLNVIRRQILSRTRLERLIQEFRLYERERRQQAMMEDVVEEMRDDIGVQIDSPARRRGTPTSFSVSFESEDARTAMQVTERLASFFVQENLEDRSLMADQTNQFLQGQLEEARRRLEEQEKKVQEFRQRNNGQLPDQVGSNLSLLQSAQTQLQTITESGSRDRDRLQYLQKELGSLTQAAAAGTPQVSALRAGGETAQPATAAQQLEAARTTLRALELRLKPDHPDVGRTKRVIAELEKKAEAEALQQPLSAQTQAPVIAVDRTTQARIDALRGEIQVVEERLESGRRETARLQAAINSHGARVEAAPALESELTKLTRDYTTVQQNYESLLRKNAESQMALNLERRQIGEQFRVIDGARLPQRPIKPDRVRINMLGLLAGLGVGLGLVALLEYRDTSFKSDDEIVTTLSLPVLAVIPVMTNASERRGFRRRRLVLAASASVACALLAVAVLVVWRYRLVDAWLR